MSRHICNNRYPPYCTCTCSNVADVISASKRSILTAQVSSGNNLQQLLLLTHQSLQQTVIMQLKEVNIPRCSAGYRDSVDVVQRRQHFLNVHRFHSPLQRKTCDNTSQNVLTELDTKSLKCRFTRSYERLSSQRMSTCSFFSPLQNDAGDQWQRTCRLFT